MVNIGPKSVVASIDIDSQCGFSSLCPQELPVPLAHEIVVELNEQAKLAQYRLGSKDAHPAEPLWQATPEKPILTPIKHKHMDFHWPIHCVPGTKGFELLEGLPHPGQYDFFVWKGVEPDMHPYGSCYHDLSEKVSTGLIEFLHHKGIKTIIVGGLATEYCVKITALQLLKAGFQTIINLGACRGIDPTAIQRSLSELHTKGAVIIHSSKELRLQE